MKYWIGLAAGLAAAACVSADATRGEAAARALVEEAVAGVDLDVDVAVNRLDDALASLPQPSKTRSQAYLRADLANYAASLYERPGSQDVVAQVETDAAVFDDPGLSLAATVLKVEDKLRAQEFGDIEEDQARLTTQLAASDCVGPAQRWCGRANMSLATYAQASGDLQAAETAFSTAKPFFETGIYLDDKFLVQVLAGQGVLAYQNGKPTEAGDMLVQAAELEAESGPGISAPVIYANAATVLSVVGRVDDAETWALAAIDVCQGEEKYPSCDIKRNKIMLSKLYRDQNKPYDALRILTEAREELEGADAPESVDALTIRANRLALLLELGQPDQVIASYSPDLDEIANSIDVERTIHENMIRTYARALVDPDQPLGANTDKAIALLDDILGSRPETLNLNTERRARFLLTKAEALKIKGIQDRVSLPDALATAQQAYDLASETEFADIQITAQALIGEITVRLGDADAGLALLNDALVAPQTALSRTVVATSAMDASAVAEDWASVLRFSEIAETYGAKSHLLSFWVRVSPRLVVNERSRTHHELNALANMPELANRAETAFQRAQSLFTAGGGETLRLGLEAAAEDDAGIRAEIAEIERLASEREALLEDALSLNAAAEDTSTFFKRLGDIDRKILDGETELLRSAPRLEALRRLNAAPSADIAATLEDGEAFLQIASGSEATHLFLVHPDGKLTWRQIDITRAALCQLVQRFRGHLDPSGRAVCSGAEAVDPTSGFDVAAAQNLYDLTIAPLTDELAEVETLVLAVDGPLASAPFAAFIRSDGPPPAAFRDQAWLIRDVAILHTPDAASFLALDRTGRENRAGRPPGLLASGAPCLGFERALGCPDLDVTDANATRGAISAANLDALPPLPGSEAELRALVEARPGDNKLLIRTDATEGALRDIDWGAFDRAVFATHVVAAGEFGVFEPGLVLSTPETPRRDSADDGYLAASEIASNLSFDLDLVVLAGCNSASPASGFEQSPLTGLARAMFASGARQLVISHTPLRDDVSLFFTDPIIRAENGFHTILQSRMLEMIDQGDPDPAAWASLVVVGR